MGKLIKCFSEKWTKKEQLNTLNPYRSVIRKGQVSKNSKIDRKHYWVHTKAWDK